MTMSDTTATNEHDTDDSKPEERKPLTPAERKKALTALDEVTDKLVKNGEIRAQLQAKQKTVDHLKETLDIMVCDSDTRRHYETFSGSEQSRLDFALGLSFAILLADRRGAESRVLLLDELEGLDEQGQRDVVKVVESVAWFAIGVSTSVSNPACNPVVTSL